jgi:hypothetical protein
MVGFLASLINLLDGARKVVRPCSWLPRLWSTVASIGQLWLVMPQHCVPGCDRLPCLATQAARIPHGRIDPGPEPLDRFLVDSLLSVILGHLLLSDLVRTPASFRLPSPQPASLIWQSWWRQLR